MKRQYGEAMGRSRTEGRRRLHIRVPKTRRCSAARTDEQAAQAGPDESICHPTIGEPKRAQEPLQASEEKYRLAMDATTDGVWDWNVATGVVDYSPAWKTILGLEEVKNEYETWASKIHPDDRDAVLEGLQAHLEGKTGQWSREYRLWTADGAWKWVLGRGRVVFRDAEGRPRRMIGTMTDISERKRVELEMMNSRSFLNSIIEQSPSPTWISDDKGTLIRINKACCDMLRITPEEVLGKYNVMEDDLVEKQGMMPLVRSVFEEGRAVNFDLAYDTRNIENLSLKQSACVFLNVTIFPIRDNAGKITNAVIQHIDVTEIRRMREEAERRQAELLHASRLSTLGEMASGFAHELNQPLTAIMNYASASLRSIQSHGLDGSRLTRNLEQIVAQSTRAGEIIRRVRAFAQRRPPSLSPVDINKVIRDTLGLLGSDLRHRRAQVVLELSEDLPPVLADSIQLEQVLLNLIRNAAEAMEAVDVQRRWLTLRTSFTGREGVQVAVADTGPGIAPEMTTRIFDPFFTTKETGLGIGLSITRSILELHRSCLSVDPGPGRGCTFAFTLPTTQLDVEGDVQRP